MNIFLLDMNHQKNVQSYVKDHITKMPLETVQLLSTAILVTATDKFLESGYKIPDYLVECLYKESHRNHPCSIWTRKTKQNFLFLVELGNALFQEFEFRRNKKHASHFRMNIISHWAKEHGCDDIFEDSKLTKPALAMPGIYHQKSVVDSYRLYYKKAKNHLAEWENRPVPEWWK